MLFWFFCVADQQVDSFFVSGLLQIDSLDLSLVSLAAPENAGERQPWNVPILPILVVELNILKNFKRVWQTAIQF